MSYLINVDWDWKIAMGFQSERLFNRKMGVHYSSGRNPFLDIGSSLTTDQIDYLGNHSTTQIKPPDTELIGEGTETESYSIIISGVVKLSKTLSDGRQQIVGLQFAQSFLGRPFGRKNWINAEAATEVKVRSFGKTIMDRIIAENPDMKHKLLREALEDLDEARDWMLALGRKNASEKVASFLLYIAAHSYPKNDAGSAAFDLPLRRSDIGDFLGLTIETISREMTRLRLRDTIQISNNRRITINDMAVLSERAGL